MKAEIITIEEAKKRGLTTGKRIFRGEAAVGAMCVAERGPDGKEVLLERSIQRADGKKDLIFMHEKRQKIMKEKKKFDKYIKQFSFIQGKEKATFIKEGVLKIPSQEA